MQGDIQERHPESEEAKLVAKKPKKSKKKWFFGILAIFIIALAAVGWWFFKVRNTGPIPKSIQKSAGFAIYYPSPLPSGYSLDKSSVKILNRVVFFNLKSVNSIINISEQTAPSNLPDLSAIQKAITGFNKINSPTGQAIIGVDPSSQEPVAIIETNTTLINVSGAKGTPSDVISKLIQNMSSLPQ